MSGLRPSRPSRGNGGGIIDDRRKYNGSDIDVLDFDNTSF